jgi:hypothetical protein
MRVAPVLSFRLPFFTFGWQQLSNIFPYTPGFLAQNTASAQAKVACALQDNFANSLLKS